MGGGELVEMHGCVLSFYIHPQKGNIFPLALWAMNYKYKGTKQQMCFCLIKKPSFTKCSHCLKY